MLIQLLLNIIYIVHIKFHWIFSESYHGKGEHDGHGATVKRSIRFYILGGVLVERLFNL